ncbi:LLM class flavin-dependent oxidoreductase [Nakamurella sp. YIM 132087]|uniref:LLM class flavin-dependent oxidoreductase n=1 Tax=Nakamurella alba TaxID=2665158 RepID=A0A7K1FT29_9ACTN|nr:LLM class flavin-dependent oxidoreductase [Nakamurella alba]MTD17315.1 LLM class flavin-dependent oxidoreductase [Nakamurella alba]
MRIGVVILPQYPARETSRRWKSLDDRGFAHGWTYDHLAWRTLADQDWHSTIVTLAIAATATERIGIGTWVASPNFRHPVTFAKDLMSLDELSGGRVNAGIGASGTNFDSVVMGQPPLGPKERVDRLTEFAELTDLLLRQRETTWQGTYYTAEQARMNPAGSRERIRMILAGNGPRSIRLAAKYDGWATIGRGEEDYASWWATIEELAGRFDRAVGDRAVPRYLCAENMPGNTFDSVEQVHDTAGRAAALGFTDLIIQWPREEPPYQGDAGLLDRLADRLVMGDLRV